MQKLFRCLLFAVAASAVASPAVAGELTVKIANGRATVIAKDVPLRQILAEWARVGNTRMVNAEKLTGGPLTLELIDMPEKDALDILLRSAAGYITAPRRDVAGASLYDRVMILATSRPPANTGGTPSAFPQNRTVLQQMPAQPPPDDDDGEPGDQGPVPPPGAFPGGPPGASGPPNQAMPYPGGPQNAPPGAQTPGNQPQSPFTAPRPGMLPPQPNPGAAPNNPYSPLNRPPGAAPPPGGGPPGTSRPGGGPDDRER